MLVYLAMSNNYDDQFPIGIYDNLAAAKQAVEMSIPMFTTSVLMYDTTTGKCILDYTYYNYKTPSFWKTYKGKNAT